MNNISLNSQAIILLTAYFNKGDTPLSIGEYSNFASWLINNNLTPADLLDIDAKEKISKWSDSKVTKERLIALLSRGNAMAISLQKWQNAGIWIITRADEDYPKRLKKHLGQKAPPILYGAGNKKIFNTQGVAIIGSRDATIEDLKFAFALGEKLALNGYSVVSGAARGIDEESMLGSISADGTTIGVAADDLMQKVLSKKYREAIMNNNLLLVSPYYPEAKFNAGSAMGRNKLIYTLADSSVVVHSGTTGGTWEGAKENLKNKWVNLFVKSNSDKDGGNLKLIEMGGLELNGDLSEIDSFDFLFENKVELKQDYVTVSHKSHEEVVMDTIKDSKMTLKEIVEKSSLNEKDVKNILNKLVVSGDIQKYNNKPLKFSRVRKLPGLME